MDYADAVVAFFAPRPAGTPVPRPVADGGPARRLRDAGEPIAMHPVWSPATNSRLAALGLDFLGSYVAGRAVSLGDPTGAVVAATFAWFEPEMIAAVWDQARSIAEPAELVAARDEATTASLRPSLGADPSPVADRLADAAEAADGTGRALFSGLRGHGRPADPVLRLWWACALVREHRGDSHVISATAAGLGPVEMNVLTELWLGMSLRSYTATRGWPDAAIDAAVDGLTTRGWLADGALSEAGRAARHGIEEHTDAQEQSIVDALGGDLDDVCGQLDRWSTACIVAGAFPADILKRAAG